MAIIQEDKYKISLEDGLTAEWKRIEREIASGSASNMRAIAGIGNATGKYADETNRLSSFIREQRAEQRQQNFLISRGREVLGAASLAMTVFGMTSQGEMKKVTNAATQGLVAFQGVEFALSALGAGPWGMVIAGGAGIATMMAQLSDNTEEAKKQIEEFQKAFSRGFRGADQKEVERMIKSTTIALNELRSEKKQIESSPEEKLVRQNKEGDTYETLTLSKKQKEEIERLTNAILKNEAALNTLQGMKATDAEEYKEKLKEISEAQKRQVTWMTERGNEAIKNLETEQKLQAEMIARTYPEATKQLEQQLKVYNQEKYLLNAINTMLKSNASEEEKRFANQIIHLNRLEYKLQSEGPVKVGKPTDITGSRFTGTDDVRAMEQMEDEYKHLGFTAENTANLIASSMREASQYMVDAMFDGTFKVEEMFKNLLARLAEMLAEEVLLKALLGYMLGGPAGAAGGSGTAAPDYSDDDNYYSTTVPRQRQTSSVAMRTQTVNVHVTLDGNMARQLSVDERTNITKALVQAVSRGKYR